MSMNGNPDLASHDFSDAFDSDDLEAGVYFRTLLLDEGLVSKRVSRLLAVREKKQQAEGQEQQVHAATEYIRELVWIRAHTLLTRIAGGEANVGRLKQLADDPENLLLASRLLQRGDDGFLQEIVDSHQAETWSWLRDRVCDGTLDRFAGKFVASWTTDESQLVAADNPVEAARMASQMHNVPMDMIAVTYVDTGLGPMEISDVGSWPDEE